MASLDVRVAMRSRLGRLLALVGAVLCVLAPVGAFEIRRVTMQGTEPLNCSYFDE